jgi:hypothetical protein
MLLSAGGGRGGIFFVFCLSEGADYSRGCRSGMLLLPGLRMNEEEAMTCFKQLASAVNLGGALRD